jgi:large repetitive protein
VSTPVIPATGSRQITIQADFIGAAGTATGATGVRATLTDTRNGHVQTLTRANGGIASWTPGSGSTPDTIVINVPPLASNLVANLLPNLTFRPGPKQLTITTANANGGVSSVNGLTVHVLGTNGTGTNTVTYTPTVVNVPPPPPAPGNGGAHALQNAIDAAAPGSLLVLSPGVYNENVLMWKPLKLQGRGAGGIVGAHELQARDPEDPRFNIPGTVIDGRYFQQNATDYDAAIAAHSPYAGVTGNGLTGDHPVLRGADITVLAKTTASFDIGTSVTAVFNQARIDGIGLTTGQGQGAGGIQLQASINNIQLTNNVLENNGGVVAGGIGVGQPYDAGPRGTGTRVNHNYNVRIGNDRVIGNGGLTQAGGVGIFYGSNGYELAGSILCSNFSVNYGAGVSHIGLSPGGKIHDNQIYYNDAVDSGGGIAIETELPIGAPAALGDGTGAVDVDRNLIQSNYSGDDGGGLFLLDTLTAPINIRNNMINNNGAADLGGAATLDDSSNVRLVNNTVANNVSTGSAEDSDGNPHSAGLASEANDPLFQAMLPAGAPDFSRPAALFNNVFWNNDAFTLSQPGPGATLVDQGFIDFEVRGTGNNNDTFTPRYSDLTNGLSLRPNGVLQPVPAGQGNLIGTDPAFVTPFVNELTVSGSRLDPQTAAVTITGQDPPVGLTGNYHLSTVSPVVDRGVRCSNTPVPANLNACGTGAVAAPTGIPGDIDGNFRPQQRTLRLTTPWDLGADELPGVPVLSVAPLAVTGVRSVM